MRTDLDAGDAQAAGLEDDADAAGSDALAEAADDAAGNQHVLGRRTPLLLLRRRRRHGRGQGGAREAGLARRRYIPGGREAPVPVATGSVVAVCSSSSSLGFFLSWGAAGLQCWQIPRMVCVL